MPRPQLILAPGKEKSLLRRHPWLFSGAVRSINGNPAEGDLVDILAPDGRWLAVGHYQSESIICKILSFDTPQVDREFFRQRLQSAVDYRRRLNFRFDSPAPESLQAQCGGGNTRNESQPSASTNVFRLVHAEGDYLPGLVCDWYNGTLVMQAHSVGMHRLFPMLAGLFAEILGDSLTAVFDKSSATVPGGAVDGFIASPHSPMPSPEFVVEVLEHGNRMRVNLMEGQKTGFFVDQRENRTLVASLAAGHRVLNCFGYTGGFSLAALRGGADYVETVDISKKAIELCNSNVLLNFGPDAPHRGVVADVLQYMADLDGRHSDFDFIILDPPAFAKNHRSLQQGLKGYRSINQRAMEKLPSGGLLMTFSCSQAVSRDDFQTMAFTAAANAHRRVRIVCRLPHPPDHPVSIYHPEGEYLKGLLLQVE